MFFIISINNSIFFTLKMRILIHTNYYNINLKELDKNTEVYLKSLEKNYKDLRRGKDLR